MRRLLSVALAFLLMLALVAGVPSGPLSPLSASAADDEIHQALYPADSGGGAILTLVVDAGSGSAAERMVEVTDRDRVEEELEMEVDEFADLNREARTRFGVDGGTIATGEVDGYVTLLISANVDSRFMQLWIIGGDLSTEELGEVAEDFFDGLGPKLTVVPDGYSLEQVT